MGDETINAIEKIVLAAKEHSFREGMKCGICLAADVLDAKFEGHESGELVRKLGDKVD